MEFEKGFNVRVYGLCLSRIAGDLKVILSRETYESDQLVKFPGGGLEHCESPQEALQREFREELNVEVELLPHHYVSPLFHRSYFRSMQLIALYWVVRLRGPLELPREIKVDQGDFIKHQELYWLSLVELEKHPLTAPQDKEVSQWLIRLAGEVAF